MSTESNPTCPKLDHTLAWEWENYLCLREGQTLHSFHEQTTILELCRKLHILFVDSFHAMTKIDAVDLSINNIMSYLTLVILLVLQAN